jgi:hypothetical protein
MGLAQIAASAADGPWILVTDCKGCLMSRVNEPASWLVLAYRVPGEAARLRMSVWRRLKAAGAVYLVNSVAALPAAPAAERLFRRLRRDISRAGGSAQLLRAAPLAGDWTWFSCTTRPATMSTPRSSADATSCWGQLARGRPAGPARLTCPRLTANWPGWLGGTRRLRPGTPSGPGRLNPPRPPWPSAPRPSTASPACMSSGPSARILSGR